jgi:tRNA dimethylallyltransferase
VSAKRLHRGDTRRIIRALEVFEKTGSPISQLQRQFDRARPADQARVFVLAWPRELLNQRIDRRVDEMFELGLVDEVQALLQSTSQLSRTASQAVGYREVIQHLNGERSLAETIELVKLRTRQFAKRQMTWFRSLSECRMIELLTEPDVDELANQIVAAGSVLK